SRGGPPVPAQVPPLLRARRPALPPPRLRPGAHVGSHRPSPGRCHGLSHLPRGLPRSATPPPGPIGGSAHPPAQLGAGIRGGHGHGTVVLATTLGTGRNCGVTRARPRPRHSLPHTARDGGPQRG